MRRLFLDLESYSEEPIASGNWNYAHHPSTEIMLATWCFDDEPEAYCWDATTGEPCPTDLREALDDEDVLVVMQNGAQFDRTVMRATGLVDLPCERICDTMVQALSHGLPGALGKLGMVFGLAEDEAKDKAGRQLIHFFCKPNRGKRNTRLTHPEKWEEFKAYALRDTTSMRIIHGKLPRWNYPGTKFFTDGIQSDEHKVWCLDQKINNRGVMADVELAEAAVTAAAAEKTTLDDATYEATDGDVTAATQRDKLLQFILKTHGITLPDMRADTLQRRLDDPDLPWAVKHLLDLRLQSSRNSSAKYKAVLKSVCDDDRLRFTMQFCGAATTGRWCLGEGSMILVKTNGVVSEKPIEQVTTDDLVYDGDEWVTHEGVVFSGDKEVIEHDGVVATAEHNVYVSTSEHKTLGEAKAQGLPLWKGNTSSIY